MSQASLLTTDGANGPICMLVSHHYLPLVILSVHSFVPYASYMVFSCDITRREMHGVYMGNGANCRLDVLKYALVPSVSLYGPNPSPDMPQ